MALLGILTLKPTRLMIGNQAGFSLPAKRLVFTYRISGGKESMCDNPKAPFLTYHNAEEGRLYWFKSDCKMWTCPECAVNKRTRVSARVAYGVSHWQKLGLQVDFITLTSHEKVRQFDHSIAVFRDAWPKLRKRAQYRNEDFHYAMFGEQHKKSSTLNVHLVATNTLSERWWKDSGRACGLGYIADVRPVSQAAGAAGYATKYLSKSAGVENWPTKFHRYRLSKQWPKRADNLPIGEQWSVFFSLSALNDELRWAFQTGLSIVNTRTGELDE